MSKYYEEITISETSEMPEVGEEVFVIKDGDKFAATRRDDCFWIGRVGY